jgi:hypothetical protein
VRKILVSVPHSGTRFVMERLDIQVHTHTHWPWQVQMDALAPLKGRAPIVAMRDPADVWASWCRRAGHQDQFAYGEFFLAWAGLHTLDQLMKLDVICVDKQTDPRIDNWDTVAPWHMPHADTLPIDLRSIYELPIVKRHYSYAQEEMPYNRYNYVDGSQRVTDRASGKFK